MHQLKLKLIKQYHVDGNYMDHRNPFSPTSGDTLYHLPQSVTVFIILLADGTSIPDFLGTKASSLLRILSCLKFNIL